MKTQLLQDIDENGSHARPPARRAEPPPQVWRRTRPGQAQPAPGGARPAPPPDPSAGPAPGPPRAAPAGPSLTETRPFGATSPHTGSATDIPGWLAERLREDAARDERAEWRSLWQRRAVTWSMGVSLLAIVAAGGLWLYEDNRVDGALGVVAHTTPEPAPAPAPVAVKLPVDNLPVENRSVLPAMPDPAPRPAGPDPSSIAVAEPLPPEPPIVPARVAAAPPVQAAAEPAAQPTARERRRSRQAAAAAAAKTGEAQSGWSARQRREETLMQCRAHGYDQRQCDRKNCEMTRFGFACKG